MKGPFIGVLGLSQGGAMSAFLSGMLEKGRVQSLFPSIDHPPLSFFINVSGFRWRFRQYDQFYPINTPSLHVIGTSVCPYPV
jgi:hypothetical protein